jgi:hypothetical protein
MPLAGRRRSGIHTMLTWDCAHFVGTTDLWRKISFYVCIPGKPYSPFAATRSQDTS